MVLAPAPSATAVPPYNKVANTFSTASKSQARITAHIACFTAIFLVAGSMAKLLQIYVCTSFLSVFLNAKPL